MGRRLLALFYLYILALQYSSAREKYCGTYLVDTMRSVCRELRRTQSIGKRSVNINQRELELDQFFISDSSEDNNPQDSVYSQAFQRKRKGIVEECCFQSCKRETLMAYC
ncbi:hypothetical protein WA026_009894 [Henosepilachna vigintioctopunctata]|uniref:Insulin-like domain-containing protein n=1 Tax=Henosepilachna vigintioctopunctata TaxID=420089 RepID=A0AAW1TS88_9CUCU